ncbi:hypothetical protein [Azospira inquinata]|uniref:Transmembrane protein n=1 Tax=Azospira inquinata TaxID=2785627 RepID=A0A975XTU4_9RHOO|nr:hypothetical protein [Azospira inquinata]QWT46572.1 hypothetical protein J8L76_02360 [Azospira inquinata]QWT48106.1 hypothetical protein Azoinq_09505 [Azospira inquinata]
MKLPNLGKLLLIVLGVFLMVAGAASLVLGFSAMSGTKVAQGFQVLVLSLGLFAMGAFLIWECLRTKPLDRPDQEPGEPV